MMNISEEPTECMEDSLSPRDKAQRIRDRIESLEDVWKDLGVDDSLKIAIVNSISKATIEHLCPQQRARRRLSVLDRTDDILRDIKNTIKELNSMWDRVHMDETSRLSRVQTAYSHMETLLSDMVSSELAMVTTVQDQCATFAPKVEEMRKELDMPPFPFHLYNDKSIKQWKALESDLKDLQEERRRLLEEQNTVARRFELLSSRLGQISDDDSMVSVPDNDVLAPRLVTCKLRDRCEEMATLLDSRIGRLQEVQGEMQTWIDRMGLTEYSSEIVAVLEVDAKDENTVLSGGFLESVEDVRKGLENQYTEWAAQQEFEYEEQMVRLRELWEVCGVSEDERRCPPSYQPGAFDVVDAAKAEVARLEELYARGKDVFDRVAEWRAHWSEKIQLESSENDKGKYTNRGGSLEARIKHENRLNKQLIPHAAEAVKHAHAAFQQANEGVEIMFEGLPPHTYVVNVMNTYDLEKQMEREHKAQMKKQQLVQETQWGTSSTSARRRPHVTPASTGRLAPPAKVARMGAAAASDGPVGPPDFEMSAISSISPTKRGDKLFPKTSSPKGSRVTLANPRFASPGKGAAASTASTPLRRPLNQANRK